MNTNTPIWHGAIDTWSATLNMMHMNMCSKYEHVGVNTIPNMVFAANLAKLSPCTRLQVAAVLVKNNTMLYCAVNSAGNNDDKPCEQSYIVCDNCNQEFEKLLDATTHIQKVCGVINPDTDFTVEQHGDDDVIVHAEINLFSECARYGIPTDNTDLYVTIAPCLNCANTILQSGVSRVFYLQEYKNTKGIDKLERLGVKVIKYQ